MLMMTAALATAAVALALVFTEMGLRLFAPQPTGLSRQDEFGLAMHVPGITRFLPQYGTTVSFNTAGMRDTEHARAKKPGVYRILLLGDSFMEALQVPFDSAFPTRLATDLESRSGMQVEVINAGVSGWGTDDELRYLTSYGLAYRPDLVLVAVTLHNDISDNLRQEWHTLEAGELVDQPIERMPYLSYKVVELKSFLASRLQIYQLWRRVRHAGEMRQTASNLNSHIIQLLRDPSPEQIEWGYQFTDRLLAQMQVDVNATGGKLALVLLPLRVQLSDSLFRSFVTAAGVAPGDMSIDGPQRHFKALAGGLGIPVIDLLPPFREWVADSSGSLYLEWDGHWNYTGHRVAAGVTAAGLMTAGVIPTRR